MSVVNVTTRPFYPYVRGQRHHGYDDKVILRVGQRRQYEYGRLMEKEHRKRPIIKQTEEWKEKVQKDLQEMCCEEMLFRETLTGSSGIWRWRL